MEIHDNHDIAKRRTPSFGNMLSFSVAGDFGTLKRLFGHLHNVHRAAIRGSANTLIGPPVVTRYIKCSAEQHGELGISKTLLR